MITAPGADAALRCRYTSCGRPLLYSGRGPAGILPRPALARREDL